MSLCGEGKEAKRLQADSTSLADLKAELQRKKAEAATNKLKGNFRPEKAGEEGKKTNIWSKENTGLVQRLQRDLERKKEEERSYERAKFMMEKKARLYDSMRKGGGNSTIADNFLVNFGARPGGDDEEEEDYSRRDYPTAREDEEWVEYTDSLGRTRKCMRKDLEDLQRQDRALSVAGEDGGAEGGSAAVREARETVRRLQEPDALSEELRYDLVRQKWEQQELENLTKENMHYSDIRFDEARTHGAGHYNFSTDETARLKEQATLRKLHEETNEMRVVKERKADKRKKEMSARIKKIRAKRRAKLGLPPEPDSESDEEQEAEVEDDNGPEDISKSVLEGLKMFRRDTEEEERARNQARREASSGSRDWDRDKEEQEEDGLGRSKEWKVMDQQEWNAKKRDERPSEFAPPSAYSEARYLLQQRNQSPAPRPKRKPPMDPKSGSPGPAGQQWDGGFRVPAAPPSFAFPPPGFPGPPQPIQFSVPPPGTPGPVQGPAAWGPPPGSTFSAPTPRPRDPMASLDATADSAAPAAPSALASAPTAPNYSKHVRLELHRRMTAQDFMPGGADTDIGSRIMAELLDSDSEEEDEEEAVRGRGAEVAPPPGLEQQQQGGTGQHGRAGFRSHHDMADAFSAGLQAQKK